MYITTVPYFEWIFHSMHEDSVNQIKP